jgi:hypothetical protein
MTELRPLVGFDGVGDKSGGIHLVVQLEIHMPKKPSKSSITAPTAVDVGPMIADILKRMLKFERQLEVLANKPIPKPRCDECGQVRAYCQCGWHIHA